MAGTLTDVLLLNLTRGNFLAKCLALCFWLAWKCHKNLIYDVVVALLLPVLGASRDCRSIIISDENKNDPSFYAASKIWIGSSFI